MIDETALIDAPIGTPHPQARCCWCQSPLVIFELLGMRAWMCPIDYPRQIAHALIVKAQGKEHARLLGVPVGTEVCLNVPLPSQVLFEECAAKNVLWGGQAGPGKSHGVRWWLYKRSLAVPGHEALLLRENWEQLEKTHLRKMALELPRLGAKLVERTAVFPNGSFIDCGHMADANAVTRYLSTEYGAIVPEEASLYPVDHDGMTPLAELSTRARKVYKDLWGKAVRPRFMPVSNPGGPSAGWLLDMFVDHTPDFEKTPALQRKYKAENWVYIPARLDDNPYQDPEYEDTLAILSKWRYDQLRRGDWHVFSGQFFSKWDASVHVRELTIPAGVSWISSMDWGTNQPGCVGYYALLPDRKVYRASEIKFQHAHVSEVAALMKKRERELGIEKSIIYRVGDPAMGVAAANSHKPHGESIADTFRVHGIVMRPGDNERNHGWTRCLQTLRLAPDGDPWFMVSPTCRYFIRTIASARSDEHDPDDVDTTCDDHALDEWRYAMMSRPMPRQHVEPTTPVVGSVGWWKARTVEAVGTLGRRTYVAA